MDTETNQETNNKIMIQGKIVDQSFLDGLEKTFETSKLIDFSFKLFSNASKQAQGGTLVATFSNTKFYMQIYKGYISVKEIPTYGKVEIKLYEI